jgi:hypothetical protein
MFDVLVPLKILRRHIDDVLWLAYEARGYRELHILEKDFGKAYHRNCVANVTVTIARCDTTVALHHETGTPPIAAVRLNSIEQD